MFRRPVSKTLAGCTLAALALLILQSAAFAQDPGCTTGSCTTGSCGTGCCQFFHCPPALKWCMEGMPRICFMPGCPKPICNPCEAPHWGYYQKCWAPWPWPPDFSHCPLPTPASQVFPGMIPAGQANQINDVGPNPRRLDVLPPAL